MGSCRDQVGQGGDGLLGIMAMGLQVEHLADPGGQAKQVQHALAIGDGPVAADPNLRGEPPRQPDELEVADTMPPFCRVLTVVR
jgi:hypothetical protein